MKVELTKYEQTLQLKEQIENLQIAARAYDSGRYSASKLMSVTMRILFHKTKNSHALLEQLDILNSIKMISTMPQPKPGALMLFGDALFCMQMGNDIKGSFICYEPVLDNAEQTKLSFKDWWNENVLKDVSNGFDKPLWYSRNYLIVKYSNQEGGAHVDPGMEEGLYNLGKEQAIGWNGMKVDGDGTSTTIVVQTNMKQVTLRQITFEVLLSLYKYDSKLFTEEYY